MYTVYSTYITFLPSFVLINHTSILKSYFQRGDSTRFLPYLRGSLAAERLSNKFSHGMLTQNMLEICFYRDARNIRSRAIDACSAGNTHADVASVVRHTTLLHKPSYIWLLFFHRRGTFDISKKTVSLHSTSSKKLIFVVYFIPAQNPVTGCFLNIASPQENFMFFFPNVQSLPTPCFFVFFRCHFRGTIRVFGRSLGSFGSIFPGSEFDRIAVLIWCKMFHDVHKFQIGKSVCKFDKLKIMFYWHVGFVYSCSWSFHSILAW